ncbi:Haloacid dehalogenase domain protein hydrolase type 3 [Pseudodesulfovibrio mercurii]|uniref:Haloacid dehalogenase domain protein hydrolase type 3 n=1 Tax=Pseudodesulfovibrio mercurii TaxID=641491 RepID=F0JI67_9BACT|nr:HAD hydrolase family protein [Pseudodesulfovibrio mercurii]EGB15378.1 Haloacid dehalogenase domain protein hydrolase type 3 [Pseudodesulfovibrio mercurii]
MAAFPPVTLLVRNIGKSARFYKSALGFDLAWNGLLVGPYGQSLRLVEGRDATAGGCVIVTLEVPDVGRAVEAILDNGGGRAEKLMGDEPLYLGPDGEMLALTGRGLSGAERIRLVVYDFDGVMTDNQVTTDQNGHESIRANRSDGLGVGLIQRLGIRQVILSTEANPVVKARAGKIGLEALHGIRDKGSALLNLAAKYQLSMNAILYVGNDINDANAMGLAGFRVAPADAHPSILALADYVTEARGGHGVVRELADVLAAGRA